MVTEIVEFAGRLVFGFLGLRYFVSRDYRNKVHKRWKGASKLKVTGEIFEVVLGLFLLGVIIYAAITYKHVT